MDRELWICTTVIQSATYNALMNHELESRSPLNLKTKKKGVGTLGRNPTSWGRPKMPTGTKWSGSSEECTFLLWQALAPSTSSTNFNSCCWGFGYAYERCMKNPQKTLCSSFSRQLPRWHHCSLVVVRYWKDRKLEDSEVFSPILSLAASLEYGRFCLWCRREKNLTWQRYWTSLGAVAIVAATAIIRAVDHVFPQRLTNFLEQKQQHSLHTQRFHN